MNQLDHAPDGSETASEPTKQAAPPVRAVAYCRCSTEEQAQSGLGIEAQLEAMHRWAGHNGAVIAAAKIDDGVSSVAPLDERPALVEALAELRAGDVLIVAKRDRLGRDPIVNALLEGEVRRRGARVVSAAGEGTASDDPTDVLMRRVVDAFAEYERLLIKARTRAALAALRRRGSRYGAVPWGDDLGPDGKTLVPNEAERALVETMREWRALGWSLRRVARELERTGVKTKQGGPWKHSSVASILRRGREVVP
jgi:DNA invertase Pin-like site-specific DNA recombinase